MCLDLSAQEWLNIGVVLYPTEGGAPTIRLLQNFAGLKCLYDSDAADNARFLADQIEFALYEGQRLPADWNIQLSQAMFIRGNNNRQIVDRIAWCRLASMNVAQIDLIEKIINMQRSLCVRMSESSFPNTCK